MLQLHNNTFITLSGISKSSHAPLLCHCSPRHFVPSRSDNSYILPAGNVPGVGLVGGLASLSVVQFGSTVVEAGGLNLTPSDAAQIDCG